MCSIANLFDTNIRKFDAKKISFFCPEYLDCVNHLVKLIFFKNKISVLEAELYIKIKIIESQAAKIICFL